MTTTTKLIVLFIILIAVAGGVIFVAWGGDQNQEDQNIGLEVSTGSVDDGSSPAATTTDSTDAGTDKSGDLPVGAKTFTMSEIALHNNATSCYTAIRGNVYNLTSWVSRHPGGSEAVLSLCGREGTATFEAQHGGQVRPESVLASFLIGTVR